MHEICLELWQTLLENEGNFEKCPSSRNLSLLIYKLIQISPKSSSVPKGEENESDRVDSLAPFRVIGLHAAGPCLAVGACVRRCTLPVVPLFIEVIFVSKLWLKSSAPLTN